MLKLQPHADGIILTVRAQPGARRNAIVGVHAGALRVAVTQAAEKGKANAAIVDVLSEALALKRSQIELVCGETSRSKRFRITGLDAAEIRRRVLVIQEKSG